MTVTLRPYQLEAIELVEASWSEGLNRPTVVLPTGTGKTETFCALIARHIEDLRASGQRALILAHRGELLEQAEAKLKRHIPDVWATVVKGNRGAKRHQFADVIIASVQTLARPRRREAIDRIGLIIVDECHLFGAPSYRQVLEHYGCMDDGGTRTVGFTATLTRMDGGLPDVWQSVAYERKIGWAIRNGFLVSPAPYSIEVPGLNLDRVRITAGEVNSGDVGKALEEADAFGVIVDEWKRHAGDRPTIAFLPTVRTTEKMRDAFLATGVAAEMITGSMGAEARRDVYRRYNDGETQVITNCYTLVEGFDAPHTSCVLLGRPTVNPGSYIQQVGRGLRLADGKSDCLILDVAGSSLKHNLAGVNDLESDCEGRCDCNCLRCGCSDRCKCGIRQCGCRCVDQHEAVSAGCRCAGSEECGCRCPGDGECACSLNADCACRGGGEAPKDKEVSIDVLTKLTEVEILGEELDKSGLTWLTTNAGIRFLPVGKSEAVFLLPDPNARGQYFQGLVEGTHTSAPVKRLDSGSLPPDAAREGLETYARGTDFTYNSRRATWRRTPATDAQKRVLRSMRVPFPEDIRKGAASDLLSTQKFSNCLDPRFSKYLTT